MCVYVCKYIVVYVVHLAEFAPFQTAPNIPYKRVYYLCIHNIHNMCMCECVSVCMCACMCIHCSLHCASRQVRALSNSPKYFLQKIMYNTCIHHDNIHNMCVCVCVCVCVCRYIVVYVVHLARLMPFQVDAPISSTEDNTYTCIYDYKMI